MLHRMMYIQDNMFVAAIFVLVANAQANKIVNKNTMYNSTHKITYQQNRTHAFVKLAAIDDKTSSEESHTSSEETSSSEEDFVYNSYNNGDTFRGAPENEIKVTLQLDAKIVQDTGGEIHF